jgi:hypothetical protein
MIQVMNLEIKMNTRTQKHALLQAKRNCERQMRKVMLILHSIFTTRIIFNNFPYALFLNHRREQLSPELYETFYDEFSLQVVMHLSLPY